MKNLIKNYINNEEGLVTIEWVGIAAVVVLAAVVISAAVMHSAQATATAVNSQQTTIQTAETSATNAPTGGLNFNP
jgi:hypothetical protein